MATATAVKTKRTKPTPDRFPSGEVRPKKQRNDSTAQQEETKKGCAVCGTIERGDSFVALRDKDNRPVSVHNPIKVRDEASIRTGGCLSIFEERLARDQRQIVREFQEDLALAALRREGRTLPSPQRVYDCTVEDCKRFFDSKNGRDLHARKPHK